VEYLQRAGQQAVQRSAYTEAISLLATALELLKTLPEAPERTQQELSLQITLSVPLAFTKGPAAPEVEQTYTRALELCRQTGETPQLFLVLHGLWQLYILRAELQKAHELGEQLLSLAQRGHDLALFPEAHRVLGESLLHLGELIPAREHLEQGIALYRPQQHRPGALLYELDSGVTCPSFAACALWFLGYPDQALKRGQTALTLAQELSHPPSLAFALILTDYLHQFRREGQRTQERAEAVIALSTEHGFTFYSALGTLLRGWALAEQGQAEEGIAQMCQGLDIWRATGAALQWPLRLALLAEAHGKEGQAEEGLNMLAEALTLVDKTGERVWEAELYRIKGELTLQQFKIQGSRFKVEESSEFGVPSTQPLTPSTQAEAEECFLKAIEVAQKQQAKSWELRASTSLARLWQHQGKRAEAHKLLSDVYNWFTEGFDTKDLQEAKALLDELTEG
jgi:predicted ATPase